jgi:hypothetical protein
MATHISSRRTQFQYFDQLLKRPAWKRRTILDFGGNVGGFLLGAGDEVDHRRYWCLDVTKRAIEIGRRQFPRAHFEHYDRYSSYFNPKGVRHLPVPGLGVKFLNVEPGDQLCQQERWCQQEESYCSYFTADYMASLFPGATVHPPVSPERQHCCILRSSEKRIPGGGTDPWS